MLKKRLLNKVWSVFILVAVVIVLHLPSVNAADTVKVTVLATSDVHGNIYGWDYLKAKVADVGLAKISTIVKEQRANNANVILLDGGDFLQGTPLVSYYSTVETKWKVHPMIEVFNKMNYDGIVLGNHEFNFGLDFLKKALLSSNATVLSANLVTVKDGQVWPVVKPYIIKEFAVDGEKIKVGVIGTTTSVVEKVENPKNYQGLQFVDQIETVQKYVNELKNLQVDAIVVVSHSGVESPTRTSPENQVEGIANECQGINLIVSGHDHVLLDQSKDIKVGDKIKFSHSVINGVPIISPKKWGSHISKGELTFNKVDGKWQVLDVVTSNISTVGIQEDPEILTLTKQRHDNTIAYLNEKIGVATGEFVGNESAKKDTALIDLIQKVQMYYGKAQLSAVASFNSQAVIPQGDITRRDIAGLYVYENYLYTIKIDGGQLKKYLEKAAGNYEKHPDYNYDMIQGVNYVIDMQQPIGSRIADLTYNGEFVQDTDVFTLALNNYRFNGGGGYLSAMGFDANHKPEVIWDSQKALGDNGQVRDLLINYIAMKGMISPEVDNNWSVKKEE